MGCMSTRYSRKLPGLSYSPKCSCISPKTLDETYSRILNNIALEYKQQAIKILQFLAYSERPLRIDEAVDMIAVETEGDQYFNKLHRMPNPHEITCYCSSLVVAVPILDDECSELQLAHLSVKEYLTSNRVEQSFLQDLQGVSAKGSIAIICLAYLLHLNFQITSNRLWEELVPSDKNSRTAEETRKEFPFAQYCAEYWISHAVAAEENNETLQSFIRQLFCSRLPYRSCYALHTPDFLFGVGEPASPLYYASLGGLKVTVKWLLDQGAEVNAIGGEYHTALQAASYNGHDKIVELLLHNRANANIVHGRHITALRIAVEAGHENIVKMLLDYGAEVDLKSYRDERIFNASVLYESALQVASEKGRESIVKLLLDHGADANLHHPRYASALQIASREGHEGIIKLLLCHGAYINAASEYYVTALQIASMHGYEAVVKLLLDNGANIEAGHTNQYTALQIASAEGHEKIVKMLLDQGANVDSMTYYYGTALQLASGGGYKGIVELLLSHGANVNIQSENRITALQIASMGGHEAIVKLLLSHGAHTD